MLDSFGIYWDCNSLDVDALNGLKSVHSQMLKAIEKVDDEEKSELELRGALVCEFVLLNAFLPYCVFFAFLFRNIFKNIIIFLFSAGWLPFLLITPCHLESSSSAG